MIFKDFRNHIKTQIDYLAKHSVCLFTTNTTKEDLWETYIESFRPEDNQVVNENRHYDCNCCKSFIRRYAGIVGIVDGKIMTIWNLPIDVPKPFDVVVAAMKNYMSDKIITGKFLHDEDNMGTKYNLGTTPEKLGNRYEHFYANTPTICKSNSVDADNSAFVQTHQVIQRSLNELTINSVNLVLDVIADGNLARGEQMRPQLEAFKNAWNDWSQNPNPELLEWELTQTQGRKIAIRNTAIGTLLINLSEGMDTAEAFFKYNNIVDPTNYKRVKPIFTEKQRKEAALELKAKGYENSLECRHAQLSDIRISDIFWANRQSKSVMQNDPLAFLSNSTSNGTAKNTNSTELDVNEFMSLLSSTKELEIFVENEHEGNLMNLLTQVDPDSPTTLAWDNQFRWSYNGDLAGASQIKKAVKLAGGNVEGVLNFRLAWNEEGGLDDSDLDAWASEPSGNHIGFSKPYRGKVLSPNGGSLDVDMQDTNRKMAVENITWKKAVNGDYKLWVNQYCSRGSKGFVAEVEFGNETHTFIYDQPVRGNVQVATVTHKDGKWSIKPAFKSQQSSKDVWGIATGAYHKVNTFMLSPNYWNNKVGNPHYFFFIEGLNNPNSVRSIYNEYLNNDLIGMKRIFEMLGAKLRVETSPNQMAGLGFTIDQKHKVNVKLDGRPYTINFTGKLVDSHVDNQVLQTI